MQKAIRVTIIFIMTAILLVSSSGAPYDSKGLSSEDKYLDEKYFEYFSNGSKVVYTLREGLKGFSEYITIRYYSEKKDISEISKLADSLLEDAYSYGDLPDEGDYLKYQIGGYDLEYGYEDKDPQKKFLKIYPKYYSYPLWEEELSLNVEKVMDSFSFTEDMTDEQKVRRIHDYIVENVSYDTVHKQNSYNHKKSTAYYALMKKTAVCQGFCVLFYRMLKEAGIDNRIVTGQARYDDGKEYHSWNLVKVDGMYYNTDITWDAMTGGYDYYLKSDNNFTSHERDGEFLTKDFTDKYQTGKYDYIVLRWECEVRNHPGITFDLSNHVFRRC